MTMFAKTVAERTRAGVRQDIEEKSYTFHAYGSSQGIAGLIISDAEYPALVAHQLLSKVVDEFLSSNPRSSYSSPSVTSRPFPQLKDYLVKYQDPAQADSIMKVQRELDETKIVLHKTIESVLERGKRLIALWRRVMVYPRRARCFTSRQRSRTVAVLSCRILGIEIAMTALGWTLIEVMLVRNNLLRHTRRFHC